LKVREFLWIQKAGNSKGLPALFYPKKDYMIDTFLFIRLLNPILSLKYLFFQQKFEVWCFHQSSNLTSVESFWRHEFIKEF